MNDYESLSSKLFRTISVINFEERIDALKNFLDDRGIQSERLFIVGGGRSTPDKCESFPQNILNGIRSDTLLEVLVKYNDSCESVLEYAKGSDGIFMVQLSVRNGNGSYLLSLVTFHDTEPNKNFDYTIDTDGLYEFLEASHNRYSNEDGTHIAQFVGGDSGNIKG